MRRIQRRALLKGGGMAAAALGLGGSLRAQAPPRRIKVGQIGVGHAHANKLAVYRASPDYEVVGVAEPDAALRARAEANPAFRGVSWLTREQLLETPGLELVLVETLVDDLLDAADAAVAAGKHVHLDKPAGVSLPRFRRLLDAAKAKDRIVQLGYVYRYSPATALLRELVTRGVLGEVFEVHAVMSKVVDPAERPKLAAYSGGLMFELGCHVIDLVVLLLGRPAEVTPFLQHASDRDDGLADNTLAVFRYPRALATVKVSGQEVDGGARRHLVACGTGGTLHIQPLDKPSARLTLAQASGGFGKGAQDITFPEFKRYVDEAADMARVLRGEKAFEFSKSHDLDVHEAVLRASGMPLDT